MVCAGDGNIVCAVDRVRVVCAVHRVRVVCILGSGWKHCVCSE